MNTPITDCRMCGHPRKFHFRTDENGGEDRCPCTASYGGGKFACRCENWEDAREEKRDAS